MKCLLILEKQKDYYRAKAVLRATDIKHEEIKPDRFIVWTSEENIKHLNTFDYMACIRYGEES